MLTQCRLWCLFLLITKHSDLHRVHPSVTRLWLLFATDTEDTSVYYLLLILRIQVATICCWYRTGLDTPSGHYLLVISIGSSDYLILISQTCLDTNYQSLPCESSTLPAYFSLKCKCFSPPLGMWGLIWKSRAGAASCREDPDSWCLIAEEGGVGHPPHQLYFQASASVCAFPHFFTEENHGGASIAATDSLIGGR